MANYLKITYVDANPNSPTYGTRRVELTIDNNKCPQENNNPEWVEYDNYCQTDEEGKNTGYVIYVYIDYNPYSPTYNQTKEELGAFDVIRCVVEPEKEPIWETISEECELDSNNYFTGRLIITQKDTNTNSETYGQLQTIYQTNYTKCPLGEGINAVWTEQSYTCNVVDNQYDGTSTVIYKDTNKYSATYEEIKTETSVNDPQRCPAGTSTLPNWVRISYECVLDEEYKFTGQIRWKEQDSNPYSPTYGTTQTVEDTDTEKCPIGESSIANWENVDEGTCEMVDGTFNGYIYYIKVDTNPHSPTYEKQKQFKEYDEEKCPIGESGLPTWEITSFECETIE